jgi:hypothetical protein
MSFNEEKYKQDIDNKCKKQSNNNNNINKCNNVSKCILEKCRPYVEKMQQYTNSKTNNNIMNDIVKNKQLMKNPNFKNANSKLEHCVANKCPEIFEYRNEIAKKVAKKVAKKLNINIKTQDEDDIITMLKLNNQCVKQHELFENQTQCTIKLIQKYTNNSSEHNSNKPQQNKSNKTKQNKSNNSSQHKSNKTQHNKSNKPHNHTKHNSVKVPIDINKLAKLIKQATTKKH